MSKKLAGTKTHDNLKAAFAGESQANRRYLYFAKNADVEGHPDLAGLFRDTAEGETGHAHGHLDFLKSVGDPATGEPIGDTRKNLKAAFAGESQANRRYLYFAKEADVEGRPDIAGLFRDTAEGETGHAHGHLDFIKEVGDPATGEPIGDTEKNLAAAVAGETYEYTQMYPGFAKQAREEGFGEIAEWFETLAKAEKSHAGRFAKGLQTVKAEG